MPEQTEVVDEVDAFLRHAFAKGSITLLSTPPGPEKEAIIVPLCLRELKEGTKVVLALSTIPPKRLLKSLSTKTVDPQKAIEEGQLKVLDWYSHKEEEVQRRTEEGGIVKCPGNLRSLDGALSQMLKASKGEGIAVLDIFTDLLGNATTKVSKFVSVLGKKLRKAYDTSILAVDAELVPEKTTEILQKVADASAVVARRHSQDGIIRKVIARREGGETSYTMRVEAPFAKLVVTKDVSPKDARSMEPLGESCPQCGTLIEGEECLVCGFAPGDDELWKTMEIYQKVDGKLKDDPTDLQAIFTKAAALARMSHYREAINVLNELTIHDPRYPGMWMLKAKLYDRLGEEAKANLCRQRALNMEAREEGAVADTAAVSDGEDFQCPLCLTWLPWKATLCSCGAEFVEEEEEYEEAVPRH